MTHRIAILSEDVANQIAAGEVIERPASVVKELVENALDAGARKIDVEIEGGGKLSIRVRDDGCGMSEQDAVLAFQRHATSKLRHAGDLFRISTLGFRGEALPSIASVSHVELTTREPDTDAGTRVCVEGGTIVEVSQTGCPSGTDVTVSGIFYNTPARLKFLRSDTTEAEHIHRLIEQMALCDHGVSFSLLHNGNPVFASHAGADPVATIASVYDRDTARQMIPFRFDSPSLRIHGHASPQNVHRASRRYQSFFVNGRLVTSRALMFAVQEAYRGLMDKDRHPIVVLRMEMDPSIVDVNVHPAKTEVRFTREWEIKSLVLKVMRDALTSRELTPSMTVQVPQVPYGANPDRSFRSYVNDGFAGSTRDFHDALMERAGLSDRTQMQPQQLRNGQASFELIRQEVSALRLRPLRQLRRTYILAEGDEGLYIINQHRAHERVLLHKMYNGGRGIEVQRLLSPVTVQVSKREADLAIEHKALFAELGFDIESFGGSAILIRSIPSIVSASNVEDVVRDAIDELISASPATRVEQRKQMMMTRVACHNAIKAGRELRDEEIAQLIRDLLQTESPFICPHGQPIIVSISHLELDRKFERI